MRQYLDLLNLIFEHGESKHPSRLESGETKNSTRGLANLHFSHDLRDGFPLLTTRKLAWSGLVGELRGFLCGYENHKDFAKVGCHFWKPWAREDGSLGPVYGAQWLRGGQLEHILKSLRERPTDRRMVASAWIPDEISKMVLPPCHLMWVVTSYNNVLNLSWIQRSCDFPIGVPYNIASYALLCCLLAKWAKMEPGTIDCIFCDAHIYDNQITGVREQLSRTPQSLPMVDVSFNDENDFSSWAVELMGWLPQPNINFGELEV